MPERSGNVTLTLQLALERSDDVVRVLNEIGAGDALTALSLMRTVLRRQALLLAEALGALKSTPGLTTTGRRICREIIASNLQLASEIMPDVAQDVEEKPVPGPTKNPPIDPTTVF